MGVPSQITENGTPKHAPTPIQIRMDELILEESAWSFMALDSIFKMLENRESRGDRRVNIAGNTGLPRKKSSSL